MRKALVHNYITLRYSSMRMIFALATIIGLNIWLCDVRQAYLQAGCALQQKRFTRIDVLELAPNKLIQILLPL